MILGIISDTHGNVGAVPFVVGQFRRRNVEVVVHCGDIEAMHLSAFGGFPVICALNADQLRKPEFKNPPDGWVFTQPTTMPDSQDAKPARRIRTIRGVKMYVGHRRSIEMISGSEEIFLAMLEEIRVHNDGVRWMFSGHTHHQMFFQTPLINFINPGAVEGGFDGYEFATVDTATSEIVFCRLLKTRPVIPTFSVGVISDSLDISKMDSHFWAKLALELRNRGVSHVIHCGNLSVDDIGIEPMKDFIVYYNLRADQKKPNDVPGNWRIIPPNEPVVQINGYRFYVQLDLGFDLRKESERSMHTLSLELRRKYPEISYVLCGFTNNALFEEGPEINIINPGDAVHDRNFAVICLPRKEITFGHVPLDPLLYVE